MSPISPVIPETRFQNSALKHLGVECLCLHTLRQRIQTHQLPTVERVNFYLLIWVTGGVGQHRVDFVSYQLSAGALLCVQPGQVQQWHLDQSLNGKVLLVAPQALALSQHMAGNHAALLALRDWPIFAQLSWQAFADLSATVGLILFELQQLKKPALDSGINHASNLSNNHTINHAIISGLLHTLLLRMQRAYHAHGLLEQFDNQPALYKQFLHALDAPHTPSGASVSPRLGVSAYARLLGCTPGTLSRACLAAQGRSAKQIIDRRAALDAARLLAHSSASVAEISEMLGFSETTNFVKFFQRTMATSPARFRKQATEMPR